MAVKKTVERDLAKVYFLQDGLTQKEIAERLKVTEKTVGKWAKEGDWEKMKVSMLVTRDNQITELYKQLENTMLEIKTRPVVRDIPNHLTKPYKLKDADGTERLEYPVYNPEDFPIIIGNFPNSKDTDIISKLTTAIKKLETETNIGETISVIKGLILFARAIDTDFANRLTKICDAFIKQKMSDGAK